MSAEKFRDRILGLKRIRASLLRPHPKNPRRHPDNQRGALLGALREIGWAAPLVAYQDGDVYWTIDGHLRADIAGDTEVPVVLLDVTPAEADKLLASMDPLSALAEQDDDAMRALLATVETENEALRAMFDGLDGSDAEPVEGQTDPDSTPEPGEHPITKPGDLWLLGEHRVLCGDAQHAESYEQLLGEDRAQLIVTSPPYNQRLDSFKPSGMQKENPAWVKRMGSAYADSMPEDHYQSEQRALLAMLWGWTSQNASVFYNHKNRYRSKEVVSPMSWVLDPWKLRQEIVWDRGGSITLNARMFMPSDERIYWLFKGEDFTFSNTTEDKALSTVWKIHPKVEVQATAPFPAELPERCIRACSLAGEIVMDPYLGSGTTLIACSRFGRRCFGIEIEPRYVDVSIRRWQEHTGQAAMLDGDGRTFKAVAAERTRE